jgi:hypothetical protein
MRFDAELTVELYENETLLLPLLPSGVTLSALAIDGKPSAIAIEEDQFAARVRGRGNHRIALSFEVPVARDDGPPHVDLSLPEVPVSELEITLPGDKEVSLDPVAHVDAVRRGNTTVSHAFLPLTSLTKSCSPTPTSSISCTPKRACSTCTPWSCTRSRAVTAT